MAFNTIVNYVAGAAVAPFRVVKLSSDTAVIQSAAAADFHVGVCVQPAGAASGARLDVSVDGPTDVEFGGTVTRGDLLTTDSVGRAITATAAAGVNVRIIGIALVSAVVGDIGRIVVSQASFQG